MFWGLIMEPHRRYTQQVKKAFHISMASLDLSTSNNEPSQVMLGYQGRNYLLCTLQKGSILQCPLDLNFEVGTEVSFASNGKGHVHLTGYLLPDELDDMDEEEGEEEEQEAVEQESSDNESVEEEEVVSGKKRPRQSVENGQPNKKSKIGKVTSSQPEEESSDDEDFDFDEENEEEEEGEEDELEEEEADSDNEEEEEESEEEEVTVKKTNQQSAKVNGVPAKNKDQPKTTENSKAPKKRTLAGGIVVEDLKEGQGPSAKNGKFVNVYYEGRLKSNNKMFDQTKKGSGFSFRLGNGEVIKGWDIGVEGMKPGGKRRITCPPKMAYGARGSPPAIPPNSTLVFEVELRKVS